MSTLNVNGPDRAFASDPAMPLLCGTDAPFRVDMQIVDSDAKPGGVGDPGLPPVVPALTHAIFLATGNRLRARPISRHPLV
jgi:isoquinoline 1-oxidoreductase beta subunit